ncbi:MAG TPA: nucleotidyltransferase family protein, partial [Marinobacter adhaerens]|nr:nucleotidyltransferase family protein [Marinobacter adhaerens]
MGLIILNLDSHIDQQFPALILAAG